MDKLVLSHSEYLKVLGATNSKYPDFSKDPLDGFRNLLSDLKFFGSEFLVEAAAMHRIAAMQESEQRTVNAATSMIRYVRDKRLRNEARAKFREQDYDAVSQIFMKLEYPDDLTSAEIKMFRIAKNRL